MYLWHRQLWKVDVGGRVIWATDFCRPRTHPLRVHDLAELCLCLVMKKERWECRHTPALVHHASLCRSAGARAYGLYGTMKSYALPALMHSLAHRAAHVPTTLASSFASSANPAASRQSPDTRGTHALFQSVTSRTTRITGRRETKHACLGADGRETAMIPGKYGART